MQKPKLSILITHYNSADTLMRAVRSVCELGSSEWEIILVDDGSSVADYDKAYREYLEIAKLSHHPDKNFRMWQKPNAGNIGVARNRTLEMAQGEYVVVLDADDQLCAKGIEAQMDFLDKNPKYGWCHTPARVMNKDFEFEGYLLSMPAKCAEHVKSWTEDAEGRLTEKLPVAVSDYLFDGNIEYSFINNWGCVIRRTLMEYVGGWSEDLPNNGCGEDYDLNLKLSMFARSKWLPNLSYEFRKDPEASAKKWDVHDGKELGAFSNYEFIRAKHRGIRKTAAGQAYPEHVDRGQVDHHLPDLSPAEQVKAIKDKIKSECVCADMSVDCEVCMGFHKRALDVGCGDKWVKIPSYKVDRLDVRASTGCDIIASADNLAMIEDETYDMIYSSHVLEHFPRIKSTAVLREWCSKLKIGGDIEILVPDIVALAKKVLQEDYNDHDLHCQLFGAHTNDYDAHHSFFTEKSIRQLLAPLGVVVETCERDHRNGPNLTVKGTKVSKTRTETEMKALHKVSAMTDRHAFPGMEKIGITTDWHPEASGSELAITFEDESKKHHFHWCTPMNGGIYNAWLHLTPDILSVEGLWYVRIYCDGVEVETLEFSVLDKPESMVDQLLEEYREQ